MADVKPDTQHDLVQRLATLEAECDALRAALQSRTRREHDLQESESRFRTLVEDSLAGVYVIQDGKIVYANRRAAEIFGYEVHEILGHDLLEVVVPEHHELVRDNIRRRVAGELQSISYEVQGLHRDGTRRDVDVLGSMTHFNDRPAIIGTVLDRTEANRTLAALHEKTRILHSILDSMGDGVAVADQSGNLYNFNPAARRITGLGPMGRTPEQWVEAYGIFLPDGSAPFAPENLPLARALRGESTDGVELLLRNPEAPDGVWIDVTGRPLADAAGHPSGGVVVFRDVTRTKRMVEELRRAEAKYRALVEQLPVVAYTATWTPLGATIYMSPQMEAKLGFSVEEWLCNDDLWVRQLHPEDRDRVIAEMRRCQTTGERFVSEYRMVGRDGRIVWFHDEGVVLLGDDGRPAVLQGVLIDVTDRQEERAGRLRLAALSSDLVALQEAERRHVATLLHNEVGQLLTGLKLQLGTALEAQPSPALAARFQDAGRLVSELIVRVRELSLELRPTVLDDLGLMAALTWLFDRFTQQTGITLRFEPEGLDGRRFPGSIETAAFRVVQEALQNVERHAGVREAWVRAWATPTDVCVQIQDAGHGFDAEAVLARPRVSGLIGMRERVLLLGGEFILESSREQGTQVTAEIPIRPGEIG